MKDVKLKLEYMATEDLTPYKNNAKIHTPEQIEQIMASIRDFGMNDPIGIVGSDNLIVEGHGRLLACERLGIKEVPVIRLDHLSEEERKAYTLAHNKLTMNTGFDMDKLNAELQVINLDMAEYGFIDIDEPEALNLDGEIEEDAVPEPPAEPKSKLGEIYKLGEHRLMCGDSTSPENVAKLMDGRKADMIFTDPPYNVAFKGRSGKFDVIENDDLSENDFNDLITASCNIIRTLNPKEYYIWCNWKFYGILQKQLDYKSCIVWAKNVFGMGKGYRHQHEFCLFNGTIDDGINNESDLWEIAKDANYVHPTQKPVALCARALKNHKDANVVVDLFGGSGSTLIACEQLNRKCYMMELDPRYVDVIIERWESLTGKKAEKVEA